MSALPDLLGRLSLKTKFVIITTIAIVLLTSAVGYLAVDREKEILYQEAERKGRLLGETLAIPIINDLIYERLGVVEEGGLLDNYIIEIFNRRDVDLLYLAILDEEGRIVSHNNIAEYGKVYDDPVSRRALGAEATLVQHITSGDQKALDFGVPLSIGKKRWGTLKFAISLKAVEEETAAVIARIGILTAVMVVLGFGIVLLLGRRFIGPITELADTMERTGGDYLNAKVEVKGHDEIAHLGERFNSMIERIRLANEEIRRTHEKMVQSEKLASLGILASGVAHEINNPLGGLFNCLNMLGQNRANGAMREKYLGLMHEGLGRIENTVNRLLWMSRRSERAPVQVNVRNAVESVRSFLDYKMTGGGVVFSNETPEDLVIPFDVHDFQQLLLNLFINAIQAMKGGGALKVSGRQEDSRLVLEISDTGIGMAKETVGRIFDPFFTTKPPGEGTGLGLWLTYEIVRNYDGEIAVASEEGKGSTFSLSFPAPRGDGK